MNGDEFDRLVANDLETMGHVTRFSDGRAVEARTGGFPVASTMPPSRTYPGLDPVMEMHRQFISGLYSLSDEDDFHPGCPGEVQATQFAPRANRPAPKGCGRCNHQASANIRCIVTKSWMLPFESSGGSPRYGSSAPT